MSNVLNVAYGMNGSEISKMSEKELIAAFFMAHTNLPGIKPAYRGEVIANMGRVADALCNMARTAKGKRYTRIVTHHMVMLAIMEKVYSA